MEWIKCENQMPETEDDVLIYHPEYGIHVAFYDEDEPLYFISDGSIHRSGAWIINSIPISLNPIYWINLPSLPKD